MTPLHILKFGGTSVGSAPSLARVAEIVTRGARTTRQIVVASAASGVTDTLARAASALDATGADPAPWVEQIRQRYERLAAETLPDDARRRYAVDLGVHSEALRRTLTAIATGGTTPARRAAVLATGERLAVPLVAAVLREAGLDAIPTDAASLVHTDDGHGEAAVDLPRTYCTLGRWHRALRPGAVPVVTGFLGRSHARAVTTLGRGGSDYTAGLLAGALQADCLERWTDVDALYTADPRRDPAARRLDALSMDEALPLARAGRLGVHARALDPLQSGPTAVRVRPTSDPSAPGTWVHPASPSRRSPVSVSSRSDSPALYLAGVGAVGTAFLHRLDRLGDAAPVLLGAGTTRGAVWDDGGLRPAEVARQSWAGCDSVAPALDRLRATARTGRPVVLVDATSSPALAREYLGLLRAGVRIVTASKHANTFEQSYFDALQQASDGGVRYRYETTVGAALPAVETVRDLRASGDTLTSIACCPSGTLTYVMDRVGQGDTFSTAVLDARARGFAEPDVRDDLSGEDVVRKLLILARTAGHRVERDEVDVEPLLPASFAVLSASDVPARLAALDAAWAQRSEAARANGCVLRYVGRFAEGRIRVGLEEVPAPSALGRLAGTDNLFVFQTERYGATSLTISGPGAGADLTAGGVLADVRKVLASSSPARLPLAA